MFDDRKIFSLKQVVSSIGKTIEERYQGTYWVKAEMHKLNLYPSGNAFPELVQKEDGKIVAQVNGSIWKQNFQRINLRFVELVREPLKEGTTLLLNVKITFHATYGISLQILDIDPSYTLGELQRERQETLMRLKKEGLLNLNQRLSFPLLPQRIAIISADTSKGLSDFMKMLDQNPWNYAFFTLLFSAYLQGDVAVTSIIQQLKRIEKVKHHFDVVVIVRGGGGEVGLSCYNNFELCKAIAQFPIPVLTGIGHSTNLTVAEMVAFRNAITPTELGDFLLQTFHEVSIPVVNAGEQLKRMTKFFIEKKKTEFNHQTKVFKGNVNYNLQFHKNSLVQLSRKVTTKTELTIDRNKERISSVQKVLAQATRRLIGEKTIFLSDTILFLSQNSMNYLDKEQKTLEQFARSVELLHPQNVLRRGYSITRFEGKTISKENEPKQNDILEIETFDYLVASELKTIKIKKHE